MDLIRDYARYEHGLAAVQLALAMLGMGALLAPRDFADVFRKPRALAVGLATQLCLVPLVASLIGRALPIEPGLAVGLVLVAAVPGGTLTNLVTFLGRGDVALSIALTAICTLGCLLTTPLLLQLLIGAHLPPEFEMPVARVALEIAVTLLLPLGAGMAFGAWLGARREAFSRLCIRGSLLAIALIIVGAAGSGRLDPRAYGAIGPAAIVACALAFQAVAWLASRAARLRGDQRFAVVIEAGIRNTNLAILVKASLFPAVTGRADPIGDGMFFAALLYGGVALLVCTPVTLWHRARGEPWRGAAAAPPDAGA